MFTLSINTLGQIAPQHGISASELSSQDAKLPLFIERIYARNVGFHECINDTDMVESIQLFQKDVKENFTDIVILGIGGSALGTICIQEALNIRAGKDTEYAKVHVIDNIDPLFIKNVEDQINLSRTLFIVITKSGTTPETLAQYYYFRKKIEDASLSVEDHFAFVTDKKKGILRKVANAEDIPTFSIPDNLGGRFSVLSAVGLLPAKLMGVDIRELIQGAQDMREVIFSEDTKKNIAFQLASIQYLLYKKGKPINVLFPYAQRLTKFSDWWRQLTAESLGKAKNEKGELVNIGITPVPALGVTDQHSQSQLYNEGPNDKLFIFIEVEDMGAPLHIPPISEAVMEYLGDLPFDLLLKTEKEGTIMSLIENNRPLVSLNIPALNAHSLGALFMLFEATTAYLGEFFEIDAYDQPGVERSKELTKELLVRNSNKNNP